MGIVVAWNDRFNVMDKPFNYGVSFGIGDNVSKITKYDNPNKEISSPYVGQRLGDIWGIWLMAILRQRRGS